ncbi:MAG: hypothetical protein M1834_007302 [Cirrosporium novae-zelandiae]|nr:MAG: hypothetical protein M1834_007302 [Cirrosporium novae-zelandiae]
MKLPLALLFAAASIAYSQVPPGFLPYTNNTLLVDFTSKPIPLIPAGILLTPADVSAEPEHIGYADALGGIYLAIIVDTGTTLPTGETITTLYWFQTGFVSYPALAQTHAGVRATPLLTNDTAVGPYSAPNPTSPPAIHHYVVLLYHQPADYTPNPYISSFLPLNENDYSNRYSFDLVKAQLGQPVAANYFTLAMLNATKTNTTVSGSATGTSTTSFATYTGGAEGMSKKLRELGSLSVALAALVIGWMLEEGNYV